MKKHIPDMNADLSHLTREELELWYNNMAYVVGLLVFQFGTNLTLITPESKMLEYSLLGLRRLYFSANENNDRVIELRSVNDPS